eukprot:1554188-Alexandrium_andersonii.AAC.1
MATTSTATAIRQPSSSQWTASPAPWSLPRTSTQTMRGSCSAETAGGAHKQGGQSRRADLEVRSASQAEGSCSGRPGGAASQGAREDA